MFLGVLYSCLSLSVCVTCINGIKDGEKTCGTKKKKNPVRRRDCRRQLDSLLSRDIFGKQEMTRRNKKEGEPFSSSSSCCKSFANGQRACVAGIPPSSYIEEETLFLYSCWVLLFEASLSAGATPRKRLPSRWRGGG